MPKLPVLSGALRGTPSRIRHPELVSGSISPPARINRWETKTYRKIDPFGVFGVEQVDLPLPAPVLELLFPQDGAFHVAEQFEMDEAMDLVTRGESGRRSIAVLQQSAEKIGRDSNVKRPVMPAGEDIDAGLLVPELHEPEIEAKWTLKQVQGDEEGINSVLNRHPELVSGSISPPARSVAG